MGSWENREREAIDFLLNLTGLILVFLARALLWDEEWEGEGCHWNASIKRGGYPSSAAPFGQ